MIPIAPAPHPLRLRPGLPLLKKTLILLRHRNAKDLRHKINRATIEYSPDLPNLPNNHGDFPPLNDVVTRCPRGGLDRGQIIRRGLRGAEGA